jgi:hypothetical protein
MLPINFAGRELIVQIALSYVFENCLPRCQLDASKNLTERAVDGGKTLIRERTGNRSLVLFDSGDEVTVRGSEERIRFGSMKFKRSL